MKKFSVFCLVLGIILLIIPSMSQAQYTSKPAVFGKPGGLSYSAVQEALAGGGQTLGTPGEINTLQGDQVFSLLGYGGMTLTVYSATGEADGTGGFDIDINIPAGATVLMTQYRVDTEIVGDGTAASWTATILSQAAVTGQVFTQNTKASALFDGNANSPVAASESDIAITPNADNLVDGFITAWAYVLEANAVPDTIALTYSAGTFTEAGANDGTIDNTTPATITLSGDIFVGDVGDNLVSAGKVVVTNLSAGLSPVILLTSSTEAEVTITGTAAAHADANDVADLTFAFQDTAFAASMAADVINVGKADLIIDFSD